MVSDPPHFKTLIPAEVPGSKNYLGWGFLGSLLFYFLLVLAAALYALIFHIATLAELMKQGGSIAQSGPAPEQSMEIVLTEEPPPPPPEHVEFARQIEPPKPVVKDTPKPPDPVKKPVQDKPKYTAAGATGAGESTASSHFSLSSSGLPAPTYPTQALLRHQSGTVVLLVQFNGSGGVSDVVVITPSGVGILDSSTRTFIRENWQKASFAGQSITVPIRYDDSGTVQ